MLFQAVGALTTNKRERSMTAVVRFVRRAPPSGSIGAECPLVFYVVDLVSQLEILWVWGRLYCEARLGA